MGLPVVQESRKPVVWLPSPIHPEAHALAESLFSLITPSSPNAADWPLYADGSVVRKGRISEEEITRSAGKLRIISRNGVGYETIPIALCKELGVTVTNLPGHNAKAVAEVALGLAISVVRRIAEFDRRMRRGEVLPSVSWLSGTVEGKTLGIVGMGNIAREVAKKFMGAFDTPLLIYSPTSSPLNWTASCASGLPPIPHTRVSLEYLLANSDIISLNCPLLPSTSQMLSTNEFAAMKKSAVLINTARGGLIDEEALVVALKTGEIGGAGLDAFVHEPPTLKEYRELLALENVVVLPHCGAGTEEIQIDGCIQAVRTVAAFLKGEGLAKSSRVV